MKKLYRGCTKLEMQQMFRGSFWFGMDEPGVDKMFAMNNQPLPKGRRTTLFLQTMDESTDPGVETSGMVSMVAAEREKETLPCAALLAVLTAMRKGNLHGNVYVLELVVPDDLVYKWDESKFGQVKVDVCMLDFDSIAKVHRVPFAPGTDLGLAAAIVAKEHLKLEPEEFPFYATALRYLTRSQKDSILELVHELKCVDKTYSTKELFNNNTIFLPYFWELEQHLNYVDFLTVDEYCSFMPTAMTGCPFQNHESE